MINRSALDAVIIADSGVDSLSGTNPLKLHLDGRVGDIQVVRNYVQNKGRVIPPIAGEKEYSWASAPRLNGIYLTSYLAENGFNTGLILNFAEEKQRFISLLKENPRAIIISTSFIFFKQALRELVEDIRSDAPDITIIAGGTFVYASYLLLGRKHESEYETDLPADDYLFLKVGNEPEIDLYIISPKGEETLCQALGRLEDGQDLKGLENTAVFQHEKYDFGPVSNKLSGDIQNSINWDILPSSLFKSGVMPLQASNGCPYNCSFCNFTKDQRLNYVKPLDRLVDELKILKRKGIGYIWFVDDNFRLGRSDLETVCRRFIAEGITIKWMCFIRASTLVRTDLALLKQAGCIELQIGLESGHPAILDNMNKRSDPDMYEQVIGRVLQNGINVSCYFITGFPGETEATAAATRDFIRRIEHPEAEGNLSWSIYPFLLSPLSPVYEPAMRRKFGLTGYLKNWKHATMDYGGAKKLALQAFFELENSGQIYRGDNLKMLDNLTIGNLKKFYRIRHLLAKKTFQKKHPPEDIFHHFSSIL